MRTLKSNVILFEIDGVFVENNVLLIVVLLSL